MFSAMVISGTVTIGLYSAYHRWMRNYLGIVIVDKRKSVAILNVIRRMRKNEKRWVARFKILGKPNKKGPRHMCRNDNPKL